MLEGRWEDAAADLARAARLRADERNYRLMAATLAISAKACERSGRPEDAAYRYLRAARSAALSGDAKKAAGWLQETERLARKAGAESILDEARRLQTALTMGSQPQ